MEALSPLDGRYAAIVEPLREYFTEEALHSARLEVEIRYLIALGKEKRVREFPRLIRSQEKALLSIVDRWNNREFQKVKAIEKRTNHDVKAVEYYLKERMAKIPGLRPRTEFIHFGLTSEDTNNLAYGILIMRALKNVLLPTFRDVIRDVTKLGSSGKRLSMLSLTHGQPATATTLGKEMLVFANRWERQLRALQAFRMQGKFGGAVGNFSAHRAAYPEVDWETFGRKFVRSLGLLPLAHTTQINPHDDIAELSHLLLRINTIGVNFSRDVWSYISRGIFRQGVIAGEVGSSTMPHKVNPIDFENAEGNLGLSSALFSHFGEKLPISRLQRDLSDSTVQRNIGVAFGYHLLAMLSLRKGIRKLSIDRARLKSELAVHPEIHAEAIQTVLRKHGVPGAYEKLKSLTRGERVTEKDLSKFVTTLELPKKDREKLLRIVANN